MGQDGLFKQPTQSPMLAPMLPRRLPGDGHGVKPPQAGRPRKKSTSNPPRLLVRWQYVLDFREMLVQFSGTQFGQNPEFVQGHEASSGRRTVAVDRPTAEFHAGFRMRAFISSVVTASETIRQSSPRFVRAANTLSFAAS